MTNIVTAKPESSFDFSKFKVQMENFGRDMKKFFTVAFELFIIWQFAIYVAVQAYKPVTIVTTIIGLLLMLCTYITLNGYYRNTAEMSSHGQMIQQTRDLSTVLKFKTVLTRYEACRHTILFMNIITITYVIAFAFITLVPYILRM